MTKDLVVGDLHATPDELGDVKACLDLVRHVASENDVDRIVFLGDLHHTFSITNVKVVAMYREWFKSMKGRGPEIWALVGNHDMPGNGTQYPHALIAYEDLIRVVDTPQMTAPGESTMFLPYFADPNLFHKAIGGLEPNLIYCHQEFNGCMYDNGFYAPHGADPEKMQVPVISGHIHTPQELGKVTYIGSPRWRTLSDANIARHLAIVVDGEIVKLVPTGDRLKRIWSSKLVEGEENVMLPSYNEKDEFRIFIDGSPDYVKANLTLVKHNWPSCRISTSIRSGKVRVRESDGIDVAFRTFAKSFKAKNGTTPQALLERALKQIYGQA